MFLCEDMQDNSHLTQPQLGVIRNKIYDYAYKETSNTKLSLENDTN